MPWHTRLVQLNAAGIVHIMNHLSRVTWENLALMAVQAIREPLLGPRQIQTR